jgi:transcription antitermination factor NusG
MSAVPDRLDPLSVGAEFWYAIQLKYRTERKVVAALQTKGVETYLPLLEETHNWSDRQKIVDTPLFSGYGFVRLYPCLASRLRILRTVGVIGFVSFGGEAIPIPLKQILDLRMMLAQKVPCALHAFLKIGQHVRIRGGCLNGLEGILEQSGRKNLVISIDSIQRSVAITIEGYELELV